MKEKNSTVQVYIKNPVIFQWLRKVLTINAVKRNSINIYTVGTMLSFCLRFLFCIFLASVYLNIRPVRACAMYKKPIGCFSSLIE